MQEIIYNCKKVIIDQNTFFKNINCILYNNVFTFHTYYLNLNHNHNFHHCLNNSI